MAERFPPRVPHHSPFAARTPAAPRVTKTVHSPYDHCMLHLHDGMKRDTDRQRAAPREDAHFAAGDTWIVCTDRASRAALAGRFVFEQAICPPAAAPRFPERSPLGVLARLRGRALP